MFKYCVLDIYSLVVRTPSSNFYWNQSNKQKIRQYTLTSTMVLSHFFLPMTLMNQNSNILFAILWDCIWYYHVTQYTIHFITAFHILSYWRIPWMPHLYSEKNITLCRWYCPIKSLLSRKIHQRIINFRE